MHCEMLGKRCARTFCMAFKHKVVRDSCGCKEMKGYCRHYKKFWKADAVQESVAQEPNGFAQIEHMPKGHHIEHHTDLSSGAQNKHS